MGYGKITYTNGETQEGLFENNDFKENRRSIKLYNIYKDPIARHIYFDEFVTNIAHTQDELEP